MNRYLISCVIAMLSVINCYARTYIEVEDEMFPISQSITSFDFKDLDNNRVMNGGTVILPEFDSSCPIYMKAPFRRACKIVSEYIPPCLPLRVKVSCESMGTESQSLVKIRATTKEGFSHDANLNPLLSTIKGVLLAEYAKYIVVTYGQSLPSVEFLTDDVDIELIYNRDYLDNISFELQAAQNDKYDFVTLAMRNILTGLGFMHQYSYGNISTGIIRPSRPLIPFEMYLDEALGKYSSARDRLTKATSGSLEIKSYDFKGLFLYAPSYWNSYSSLRTFIPDDKNDISHVLAYNFSKNVVWRSLNDDNVSALFRECLAWEADKPSGDSSSTYTYSGSSSLVIPYNDGVGLPKSNSMKRSDYVGYFRSYEIEEYMNEFHPYGISPFFNNGSGISLSILKKDGTWDMVYEMSYNGDLSLMYDMRNWVFHYPEEIYDRNVDGCFRGRITRLNFDCYSEFFLVDYLPQKVNLEYEPFFKPILPPKLEVSSGLRTYPVTLFFDDIDGIDVIILEALKEGETKPTKIPITDLSTGSYSIQLDKTTTFTAIAYNKNGMSKGNPLTVPVSFVNNSISAIPRGNCIEIKSEVDTPYEYHFLISSLEASNIGFSQTGKCTDNIDISNLPVGHYVLKVMDHEGSVLETIKFLKD